MKASELVKAMTDAGAPMEAVLIALRAIEEGEDAIEQRRAADRERKRRQRAKDTEEDVTVTGRSQDTDGTVTAAPSLSPSPKENNSNPHPHTHPDNTPRARKADDFPMPEWCPSSQVWRDLKANRKAKRLPCTATAHAKLIRDIEKMADDEWPPGRLLEAIVARGWAAAYDPRENRKPGNDARNSRQTGNSTRNAAQGALLRLTG